jgi:argininosuccinate lyase
MRIWLLDQVTEIGAGLIALIRVMVERADQEKDYLMPGYTHLQVPFSVYLMNNVLIDGTLA